MGLIQFDKPRARPTPNDVGASKAWIGRGLVALFDARYGIERISGDRASVNTATRAVSEGGVAADFSGTANQRYAHRPAYAQSGPFSLLILCDIDALTGYGALISKQQSSTTHCPYELRIGSGATDSKFEVVRCSATNFGTAQASATSILSAPAKLVRLVLSVTNSDKAALGTLWVNGVGYSLNGIVSGEDATGTGTPDVWIGRRQDGATQLDGRIYHIGLVNRAVTAGEAYDFTRNPWSVFEPKRIWVPVSAGGDVSLALSGAAATSAAGNTSAGISTALTGVSSTAATGTLATSTSVALTGVSSTSAAGTLAASISAALTGASATAATGTLTAGGDATAAVTGQAASTAQGTLGVTVSGAAALSGASVAASAGTLSAGISTALTGASAAVSTGSLVAGGDVSVTIAGQAVSTAQGTVGVTATGAATVALTGAAAVIAAGNIFVVAPAVGWTPVDDSDPNAWIPVDDSNAALWV